MKRLAILTFILGILGIFVTPVHAQAQKPVSFNGMIFDSPPATGLEAPSAPAKPRASHHVKRRTHHKPSAS